MRLVQTPVARGGSWKMGGAFFSAAAANRKLAPVAMEANTTERLRPVPQGPYCSSTYVSIEKTCPTSCAFYAEGCYVRTGFTAQLARELDVQAFPDPLRVIHAETLLIDQAFGGGRWRRSRRAQGGEVPQDGARGGRDLRLHVGGDTPNAAAAALLASAAHRWQERGGGAVWTYTHRWRQIPREAWGPISVLASVETPEDAHAARRQGYRPAIVVREFPDRRRFQLADMDEPVVPCPAETGERTCVECRLCLSERPPAIAFAAHGGWDGGDRAARRLPVLQPVTRPAA